MDPRIAIWNVLHDGEITVVSVHDSVLTMFVNIPYVRERLQPLGDSFVLRLRGFRALSLFDSSGHARSTNPADLSKGGYEILSALSEDIPVTVELSMGSMALDFDGVEIALDTGSTVSYEQVRQAAEDYWAEWEAQRQDIGRD